MKGRRKCRCGAERMLVRPRWFNTLKRPTWICIAKSCPYPRTHQQLNKAELIRRDTRILVRSLYLHGTRVITLQTAALDGIAAYRRLLTRLK